MVWLLQWAWAYFGKSIWLEPKKSLSDAEKPKQTALPDMTERRTSKSPNHWPQYAEQQTEALTLNGSMATAFDEAAECHRKSANASLTVARLFERQTAEMKQLAKGSNAANNPSIKHAGLHEGTSSSRA